MYQVFWIQICPDMKLFGFKDPDPPFLFFAKLKYEKQNAKNVLKIKFSYYLSIELLEESIQSL